jgi:dTDP-4-amino-4,6-dideoxygalactose transaminase
MSGSFSTTGIRPGMVVLDVGCGSGVVNGAIATLLALGVGPGDEVIVPAMTALDLCDWG